MTVDKCRESRTAGTPCAAYDRRVSGRLYTGTSGFAYPDWAPGFYPPGTRGDDLLPRYAARLSACELNNTYYRQPTEERIRVWVRATPEAFRFTVKAQRGGSVRALLGDPADTLDWLLRPLRAFGERLGTVLYRVPGEIERDDARLAALLAAWPRDMAVAFEFRHPSWAVDEVFDALRSSGAGLCATDFDEDPEPPTVRLTGSFLYLRLRRSAYDRAALATWAARLAPFLDTGHDAFVFFRHDADGTSALRAEELPRLTAAARAG